MDKRTIGYWVTTALFCAVLGFSGVAHFGQLDQMVESMTTLGYPTYFMTIIGAAKLLGQVRPHGEADPVRSVAGGTMLAERHLSGGGVSIGL